MLRAVARAGKQFAGRFDRAPSGPSFARILVFQSGGIGDILRAFPVIESLREHFPGAFLATLSGFAESLYALLPQDGTVSEALDFDPHGRHRSWGEKARLLRSLRKRHFDLIVNPSRGEGMLQNTLLAWATAAPTRVGFEREGAGFSNTVKVPFRDDLPIVEQNLALLRAIGIQPQIREPRVRVPEPDRARAAALLAGALDSGRRRIALHLGSQWRRELRWPLERYVELASELLRTRPCVLLLLGTREEASQASHLAAAIASPSILDLTAQTTLAETAGILERVELFIGHDSGLLHLAVALGVPSVGLFGSTSPRQVLAPNARTVTLHRAVPGECYLHGPFEDIPPLLENPIERIRVADVVEAAEGLLQHANGAHPLRECTTSA